MNYIQYNYELYLINHDWYLYTIITYLITA